MKTSLRHGLLLVALFITAGSLHAGLLMPPLFGDHMVLQRDHANPVWGWSAPGEEITVTIAGQRHVVIAGADGAWRVKLQPLAAGGPHQLSIRTPAESRTIEDVLVGEVWICSGQSNMEWPLSRTQEANIDLLMAKHPTIRLITVPRVGTQEKQRTFEGGWEPCTPESARDFSAIGYYFGRILATTLEVPIGLIDNAWGGSAAEAWIDREFLAKSGRFDAFLASWKAFEASYDRDAEIREFKAKLAAWEAEGRKGRAPRQPMEQMSGNHRPGNIFNGVLYPTIGYGIRGVIWYQGESNARRAAQYRDLFPLLIAHWRELWGQGDFPFYYVQLADFMAERPEPVDSEWAELREAQTMTLARVPHTGQAVTIDLGEGRDIHPRNKQTVAHRLARWALARDYGVDLPFRSPTYASMAAEGAKIIVTFDHVGERLYAFDTEAVQGFAVAGEDRKFHWADARVVGTHTVEVSCEKVPQPVAVRYAWADNPRCNLYSSDGLPATPFRSDSWAGVSDGKETR